MLHIIANYGLHIEKNNVFFLFFYIYFVKIMQKSNKIV